MAQCIAKDGYGATAEIGGVEQQVEAALDWLRPQLLEIGRSIQQGALTPLLFFQLEWQLVRLLSHLANALQPPQVRHRLFAKPITDQFLGQIGNNG